MFFQNNAWKKYSRRSYYLNILAFLSQPVNNEIFQNYIVYYTENPNAHFSMWERITVRAQRIVFPDLRYDWFYTFSATACFKDGQRSPLSRALFVKTDKLEFRPKCSTFIFPSKFDTFYKCFLLISKTKWNFKLIEQ